MRGGRAGHFAGGVLYLHVFGVTRDWLAGVSAVVLYASSTLVFVWFTVVKTHCVAGLLLFSAYAVLNRSSTNVLFGSKSQVEHC